MTLVATLRPKPHQETSSMALSKPTKRRPFSNNHVYQFSSCPRRDDERVVNSKQQLGAQSSPSDDSLSADRKVVIHNYHDHANVGSDDPVNKPTRPTFSIDGLPPRPLAKGGVITPFPNKLHEMLEGIEQDGHGHIVSWQPHGRCFQVRKQREFVQCIMPKYFRMTKFASFQRQLNLYGFSRLTSGLDRGGYYNELFLRGRSFLLHRIVRTKVKGTVRMASNPQKEPDFYAMPFLEALGSTTTKISSYSETPRPPSPVKSNKNIPATTTTAAIYLRPQLAPTPPVPSPVAVPVLQPNPVVSKGPLDPVVSMSAAPAAPVNRFDLSALTPMSSLPPSTLAVVSEDEDSLTHRDIDILLEAMNLPVVDPTVACQKMHYS